MTAAVLRPIARPVPTLMLALLVAWGCGPGAPDRIVVITMDTTRADALGAYGQPDPTTPRIDAMAAQGFLFEQAFTSAPSTLPAHASLFTGRQPYSHGVRSNTGYLLAAENLTLAEVLGARGFATRAEVAAAVLARETRLEQGFDVYWDPRAAQSGIDSLERGRHQNPRTRSAEEITERGLAFVREHAGAPFFLWLHYFDAHEPHAPPERFRRGLPPYYAEIRRIDHHVGLLLDELERLGLRERALVVLTSDHGEGLGQHGEKTHSFFVYDSTMHVPLVFWGSPRIPPGRRSPALVRLIDIAPTLLDLAGLPPLPGAEGVSLTPLFREPGADLGLTAYGESIEPMLAFGSSVLRFVRHGRWKYVHKIEPELFDIEADPRELRNLSEAQPGRVAELRGRLEALVDAAPAKPGGAALEVDAARIAELQALGYVAADAAAGLEDERASLELRGPDPTQRIGNLRELTAIWGKIQQGEYAVAVEWIRPLVEANPDSPALVLALSEALGRADREAELLPVLRRGLELEPRSTRYRIALARRLGDGELPEAERLLREAMEIDPCSWRARLHLSEVLKRQARFPEQRELLEEAVPGCPGDPSVKNALAWLLATSPDAEQRDGARAVALAREVVSETGGGNPSYLDTLAAAHAEAGDLASAVGEQRRVLEMVRGRELPPGVEEGFARHLAEYEAGRPLRDP